MIARANRNATATVNAATATVKNGTLTVNFRRVICRGKRRGNLRSTGSRSVNFYDTIVKASCNIITGRQGFKITWQELDIAFAGIVFITAPIKVATREYTSTCSWCCVAVTILRNGGPTGYAIGANLYSENIAIIACRIIRKQIHRICGICTAAPALVKITEPENCWFGRAVIFQIHNRRILNADDCDLKSAAYIDVITSIRNDTGYAKVIRLPNRNGVVDRNSIICVIIAKRH